MEDQCECWSDHIFVFDHYEYDRFARIGYKVYRCTKCGYLWYRMET